MASVPGAAGGVAAGWVVTAGGGAAGGCAVVAGGGVVTVGCGDDGDGATTGAEGCVAGGWGGCWASTADEMNALEKIAPKAMTASLVVTNFVGCMICRPSVLFPCSWWLAVAALPSVNHSCAAQLRICALFLDRLIARAWSTRLTPIEQLIQYNSWLVLHWRRIWLPIPVAWSCTNL